MARPSRLAPAVVAVTLLVLAATLDPARAWAIGAPYLVKDINPGSGDASPLHLVAVGNRVVFVANDGATGSEPWASDGTTGGTVPLADIVSGPGGSVFAADPVVAHGGLAYFPARNSSTFQSELWRTDGTPGGTALAVPDVSVYEIASAGTWLAFEATTPIFSTVGLYRSDGTAAGTTGPLGFGAYTTGDDLVRLGGGVLFPASDGSSGNELFRSDGTTAGTTMVKDLYPGGSPSNPQQLTPVGSRVFFFATDATDFALWCSDGTGGGTVKLGGQPVNPPANGPQIVDANGTAFAILNDGAHGAELWKSDGTPGGTTLVKDINPGAAGALVGAGLAAIGGRVYFSADDGVHGPELWRSDGTDTGTVMLKEIVPGSLGSAPTALANANGLLFFRATDTSGGAQPWVSDGTTGGTAMVGNLFPGGQSLASGFTYANGLVFFSARGSYATGIELWAVGGLPVSVARGGPEEGADGGEVALGAARPNPLRTTATIDYTLPAAGRATLRVFDAAGREVATLADGMQDAGAHRVVVDAAGWPSGAYFCRLEAAGRTLARKVLVRR